MLDKRERCVLLPSVVSSITTSPTVRRSIGVSALIAWILMIAGMAAGSQGLGEFVEHLTAMESRMNQALGNPRVASDVINELDADEGTFAHFTTVSGESRADLIEAYNLLDRMLGRMYETYHKKHDECLTSIGNGAVDCDYSMLEQLELRALYPLSWLRFHGSILFNAPEVRRRMLKQAAAGFTQSALVIVSPELIRENLLGRAYCERDLGQFDRSHYTKAIADFREVMKAGAGTAQYRAAQQGLATTYAAMGEVDKAAALSTHLANDHRRVGDAGRPDLPPAGIVQGRGRGHRPERRAELHREAVELLRSYYGNRKEWSLALAAVVHDVANPEAEFGSSKDPFELYLLAEVLASTHHPGGREILSGSRPRRSVSAGLQVRDRHLLREGRLDLIDAPLQELARQRHSPMGDWAAYMRFKIARTRWERSGMHDARLNDQWIARARDYVDHYPRGNYAYEPRFRLAELLQRQGKYSEAAAHMTR